MLRRGAPGQQGRCMRYGVAISTVTTPCGTKTATTIYSLPGPWRMPLSYWPWWPITACTWPCRKEYPLLSRWLLRIGPVVLRPTGSEQESTKSGTYGPTLEEVSTSNTCATSHPLPSSCQHGQPRHLRISCSQYIRPVLRPELYLLVPQEHGGSTTQHRHITSPSHGPCA